MQSIIWFWTTGRFNPDWVEAVAAIALVLLTFIALLILFRYAWDTRTLANTSRQTAEAAETASQTAIAQIQAMVDKERARVFVFPTSDEGCKVDFRNQVEIGAHGFKLINVGSTPAINLTVYYQAVATPSETEAEGKEYSRAKFEQVIAGNKESSIPFLIRSGFTPGSTAPARFFIHVWGEVVYEDVISTTQRSTRFSFRATMTQISGIGEAVQEGEWVQFGAPKENYAT